MREEIEAPPPQPLACASWRRFCSACTRHQNLPGVRSFAATVKAVTANGGVTADAVVATATEADYRQPLPTPSRLEVEQERNGKQHQQDSDERQQDYDRQHRGIVAPTVHTATGGCASVRDVLSRASEACCGNGCQYSPYRKSAYQPR